MRKNQAPRRLWSARRQIDAFYPKKPQRGFAGFVYDLRVRSVAFLPGAVPVAPTADPAVAMMVPNLSKAA